MFVRLSPDTLAIIASYVTIIELHVCVTHLSDSSMRARLPRWDIEVRRTQAFRRRFGTAHSSRFGLPFHVTTKPNNVSWCVFMYTYHLDVAALLRLAAIPRSWVKPMNQVSQDTPTINVRMMPHYSNMLNADFEWLKFVDKRLEISRFDYRLLTRMQSKNLRAPLTF